MVKRTMGERKLSSQVRQRLAELAAEARQLVYGEAGCPKWGTLFAEIEDDAKEVGHEFIRLLMQQAAEGQVKSLPKEALITDAGEVAQSIGTEERTIETESGEVSWNEPQAYLPKSRKAFFPSVEGFGTGGG
jgi:hypothetical protein